MTMEDTLRATMHRAFCDALDKISAKPTLTPADVGWLCTLIEEIVGRMKGLVPRRTDLHKQMDAAIDVDLIRQMLLNDAFDAREYNAIVNATYDTLALLCAPSQDSEVARIRAQTLLTNESPQFHIGQFIAGTNRIIDDIEAFLAMMGD